MATGAYGLEGIDLTFKAARDLSSYQYCCVYLSAADTVDYGASNGRVIGILQNKPDTAGDSAIVRVAGVSKHKVNEVVDRGTMITASASAGLGEEVDAASEWFYAIALQASAAQNDIITVLLTFGDSYASDA